MASHTAPNHFKTHITPDGVTYGYIYLPPTDASKPTILLLHGFPSTVWDWRHIIPLLTSSGAGVIAPDLLGYGDTDKPHDPAEYRLARQASHIESILKAESIPEVIGLAHDWGAGMLSGLWLFKPHLLTHLAYISAGHLNLETLNYAGIEAINKKTKEAFGQETFGYWSFFDAEDSSTVLEEHNDAFLHIQYCKDPADWATIFAPTGVMRHLCETDEGLKTPLADYVTPDDIKVHKEIFRAGGYRGGTNWYRAALRGVNEADLKTLPPDSLKITKPALYIATTRDVVCHPELFRPGMAALSTDFSTVDIDCSHWAPLEKPREVVDAVRKWAGF